MTTAAARKVKAKRARRPIYLVVDRLMDPATGEMIGCLRPANMIDQRLMKERRFAVGKEIRAELKQSRNPAFHRLAHAVGNLLVDNVDKFAAMTGHDALKEVQRESGVCCDVIELDLGTLGRVPVKQPRSIAFDELEESDFKVFFDGVTHYIDEHYLPDMPPDVKAEYLLMVEGS